MVLVDRALNSLHQSIRKLTQFVRLQKTTISVTINGLLSNGNRFEVNISEQRIAISPGDHLRVKPCERVVKCDFQFS